MAKSAEGDRGFTDVGMVCESDFENGDVSDDGGGDGGDEEEDGG